MLPWPASRSTGSRQGGAPRAIARAAPGGCRVVPRSVTRLYSIGPPQRQLLPPAFGAQVPPHPVRASNSENAKQSLPPHWAGNFSSHSSSKCWQPSVGWQHPLFRTSCRGYRRRRRPRCGSRSGDRHNCRGNCCRARWRGRTLRRSSSVSSSRRWRRSPPRSAGRGWPTGGSGHGGADAACAVRREERRLCARARTKSSNGVAPTARFFRYTLGVGPQGRASFSLRQRLL